MGSLFDTVSSCLFLYRNIPKPQPLQSGRDACACRFFKRNAPACAISAEGEQLRPTYAVCPAGEMPREGRERLSLEGFPLFAPKRNGDFSYSWNGYRLELNPVNLLLQLTKDGCTLLSERTPMGCNLGGEYGEKMRHYLVREPGERIFGLGDKGGKLNKAGRRFGWTARTRWATTRRRATRCISIYRSISVKTAQGLSAFSTMRTQAAPLISAVRSAIYRRIPLCRNRRARACLLFTSRYASGNCRRVFRAHGRIGVSAAAFPFICREHDDVYRRAGCGRASSRVCG